MKHTEISKNVFYRELLYSSRRNTTIEAYKERGEPYLSPEGTMKALREMRRHGKLDELAQEGWLSEFEKGYIKKLQEESCKIHSHIIKIWIAAKERLKASWDKEADDEWEEFFQCIDRNIEEAKTDGNARRKLIEEILDHASLKDGYHLRALKDKFYFDEDGIIEVHRLWLKITDGGYPAELEEYYSNLGYWD